MAGAVGEMRDGDHVQLLSAGVPKVEQHTPYVCSCCFRCCGCGCGFTPLKGDLSHIAGLAAALPLRCWCCLDGASQTVTHSHPLFSFLLPTLLRSHLQVQLLPEPSLGVDFVIRLATALRSKPQGVSR